jgi:hypothetical protein
MPRPLFTTSVPGTVRSQPAVPAFVPAEPLSGANSSSRSLDANTRPQLRGWSEAGARACWERGTTVARPCEHARKTAPRAIAQGMYSFRIITVAGRPSACPDHCFSRRSRHHRSSKYGGQILEHSVRTMSTQKLCIAGKLPRGHAYTQTILSDATVASARGRSRDVACGDPKWTRAFAQTFVSF